MSEQITEARATAKTVRIAPRKARLVIDLIRGRNAAEALAILEFTPRAASPIISKVLKSAIANAEHNYDLDVANLIVTEAFVNEGPTMKRFRPRAKGSASPIMKRTSHVTVVVSEQKEG
ncbi:50S ribosomal protein L22 [Isobaculum melis]|uniref:Large ribosomal subunit protein uL22 n=1 Tax=Isobaculum melis TaxID=142588 RepID=A0A1H9SFH4_9LACT|nr:50S ribosomal protein L22 [Isobaculum melis]SER83365.1 LSU ribosomal protein L22P [Isobaculum melis]